MGRDSEDKAERVLAIYTKLKNGKIVYKEKESIRYNVSSRTIQRDLSDIQCFLQNQNEESGEIQEIVYDKNVGGYILQMKQKNQIEGKEILAVAKILLESRALTKKELFPILSKLINLCRNEDESKLIYNLIQNEMFHFVELKHEKPLLDKIWQLEQVVKKQQYIEIMYERLKDKKSVLRKLKPVAVMHTPHKAVISKY